LDGVRSDPPSLAALKSKLVPFPDDHEHSDVCCAATNPSMEAKMEAPRIMERAIAAAVQILRSVSNT